MESQWTRRWRAASRREQYLLVGLAGALALAGLARLHAAADASTARVRELAAATALAGDGVDEALWRERALPSEAAAAGWREATWQGSSYGVLSAEIQTRLMAIGVEAGFAGMIIEVDPAPLDIGTTSVLRFRMSGAALYGDATARLLAAIAANEKRLILDEASIANNPNGSGRVNLSGVAPIIIGQTSANSGETPS